MKSFRKELPYLILIYLFTALFIFKFADASVKKIPDLPPSATVNSSDLFVFENLSTGKTSNIQFSDLVANFPLNNIYSGDGVLTSARTLTGNGYQHTLTFDELAAFTTTADDTVQNSNASHAINAGDLVTIGTTNAGSVIEFNPFGELRFNNIQNDDTQGAILVLDPSNNLKWRDATTLGQNIYNSDGILNSNRFIDGDNFNQGIDFYQTNFFNVSTTDLFLSEDSSQNYININSTGIYIDASLTPSNTLLGVAEHVTLNALSDLSTFAIDTAVYSDNSFLQYVGTTSYSYMDSTYAAMQVSDGGGVTGNLYLEPNYASISSNGAYLDADNSEVRLYADLNVNLTATEDINGNAGNNVDFRAVPDWDTVSDLSGRIYSGNDVLDLSTIFGANIRGTGFFNSRTSNNLKHYIFAGDSSGAGGPTDNVAIGITDSANNNVSMNASADVSTGEHHLSRSLDNGSDSFYEDVRLVSNEMSQGLQNGFGSYYYKNIQPTTQIYEFLNNPNWQWQSNLQYNSWGENYSSDASGGNVSFEHMRDAGAIEQYLSTYDSTTSDNGWMTIGAGYSTLNAYSSSLGSNAFVLNSNTSFIYTMQPYTGSNESIVVRDNTTGELRAGLSSENLLKRKSNSYITGDYTASDNQVVIYDGLNSGAPFNHTVTLPVPLDGMEVVIKVRTSDELEVVTSGGSNIEGGSSYIIDGVSVSRPAVTFYYSSNTNEWTAI